MGGKNKSTFDAILKKVTHQSDVSPPGLKKYDLIIAGGHIGGLLTRHIEPFDHGHHTTYVAFDSMKNMQHHLRPLYETQVCDDNNYTFSPKISAAPYVAGSDGVGISEIHPDRNTIKLENGTQIEYGQLVLSYGIKDDLDDIKGFRQAWEDDLSPVYSTVNSDKWSNGHAKYTRWIGNYTHGDAFFYIPKYPFRGEIAAYTFLNAYESWEYFKKIGKVSPLSTLTIVNANDKFSQFNPEADQVIRKEIAKRNINVIENTELIEVQKDDQKILLRDANGKVTTKDFNNLYVIPRGRPQESAIKAGLTDHTGFLDVDPRTLQTKKYENIFGLGDINSLGITRSYWGTFHQLHVVRHNLLRAFKGLPPNAAYDGFNKTVFYTGADKCTFFAQDYKGPARANLFGLDSDFVGGLAYGHYARMPGKALKIHLGKNKGPPYGEWAPFGKNYKGEPIVRDTATTYKPEKAH